MNFNSVFPVATWLWRHISSRWACRIYLWGLAIIVTPAVALRVQAFLFERQAIRIASGLSSLRIGATSKAEALSRIPGLAVVNKEFLCSADECFSVGIPNSGISNWTLLRASEAGHGTLFSVLSWWGVRYWSLDARVNFNSGRVSDFGYRLMLSAPHAYPVPGGSVVEVSSRKKFADRWQLDWNLDESPEYQVYHYFKWPLLNTGVYFTRNAPVDLVRHAFDLHLRCVWSVAGCETANQLLPEAEQDRLRIRQAAIERMGVPDQCPARILSHRARDVDDILVVELKNVSPQTVQSEVGTYRLANFRLLRVLKGKPGRPLDHVWVMTEIDVGEVKARNSALDLLSPGQRILLFSGASTNIDEPCEAMAGTEDAVQTIETALSATP
jgi:hypothetical protein